MESAYLLVTEGLGSVVVLLLMAQAEGCLFKMDISANNGVIKKPGMVVHV
jgi:hypothetical protein